MTPIGRPSSSAVRAADAALFLFGRNVTRLAAMSADIVDVRNAESVLVLDRVPISLSDPAR
ncbi:hypothetical protein ACFWJ4_22910 [Kitasatospora sp. NPDC127067]|uniref:hypothetical protein n=1 Tax=Kitasatospora sp. NPDC127067 TaxID=3347126 RepID=UPI00364B54DE